MRRLFAFAIVTLLTACGGATADGEHAPHGHGDDATSGSEHEGNATSRPQRSPDDLNAHSRSPDAEETAFLERLVELTSQVRGLAVQRPIVTRVASASNIARHLIATIEDEDIVDSVDTYVAIGLLEPGTDVVAILARVVGEQVVGFYDPELDVLVIRDDVMASLVSGQNVDPEAIITIAHEVIHALQGQHLDLRTRMDEEHDTDFDDAYQALVEGDATLGMLAVASRLGNVPMAQILGSVSDELDFAADGAAGPDSAELTSSPAIIRIGMTAPYIAGLGFCAALYQSGGYASVDGAHVRRPASTEQVMHPEKYASNEVPHAITLGALPALRAAGYEPVREDTLGELEVGIYLGRSDSSGIDTVAGAGWGGDRLRLYRRGGALAAVFAISFDTEADAVEAEAAAHRADARSEGRILVRHGRVLVAAHGIDAALRVALAESAASIATSVESSLRAEVRR